jgi:hypothetical protein
MLARTLVMVSEVEQLIALLATVAISKQGLSLQLPTLPVEVPELTQNLNCI